MPGPSDEQHHSESVEADESNEPIDLGEPDLVLRNRLPQPSTRSDRPSVARKPTSQARDPRIEEAMGLHRSEDFEQESDRE